MRLAGAHVVFGLLLALAAAQHTAAQTRTAFPIEALGGVTGSLAGFGVGYALNDRCDVEDTVCILESAGAAVVAGTVLSAAGTWAAGRLADTNPSAPGAALGAIAGAAAGIGAWHLLTQELNVVKSDVGAVLAFSVTQGLLSALGSRIWRDLRD